MADLKRKNEAVTQDGAPYNKRARPTSDDETRFRADEVKKQSFYEGGATTGRTDSGSGQKQVFPGLDEDDDGDEPFYGPANDGIEYLRMVRTEARGVPDLLYSEEQAPSDQDDHRAWYSDGAYIARPILGPQLPSSLRRPEQSEPDRHRRNTSSERSDEEGGSEADDSALDPAPGVSRSAQSAYYTRLLKRFTAQVHDLHQPLPEDVALQHHSLDEVTNIAGAHSKVSNILLSTIPTPMCLARMHLENLLEVIESISQWILKPKKPISSHVSVWIWGLLARLAGFIGSLSTEDVSVVRHLAKRALNCAEGFMDGQDHVGEDSEVGEDVALCSDDDAPEDGLLKESGTEDSALNSRVTLDMIVTVVGEVFGQRDLLDSRKLW